MSEDLVIEIKCPACKSAISSDGKELKEKSSHLEKLEIRADRLEELKSDHAALKAKFKKLEDEQAPEEEPVVEDAPVELVAAEPEEEGIELWRS